MTLQRVVERQCGHLRGLAHEIRSEIDRRELADRKIMRGWAIVIDGIAEELTLAVNQDFGRTSDLRRLGKITGKTLSGLAIGFAVVNGAHDAGENYEVLPEKMQAHAVALDEGIGAIDSAIPFDEVGFASVIYESLLESRADIADMTTSGFDVSLEVEDGTRSFRVVVDGTEVGKVELREDAGNPDLEVVNNALHELVWDHMSNFDSND